MASRISHYFPTISDLAVWCEDRADEKNLMAQSATTKRKAAEWRGEASAFQTVAELIRDSEFGTTAVSPR